MNINEQLSHAQDEYNTSSSRFFKFEKGKNRIRILTEGEPIATHFFGKGVPGSICYGKEKGCPFHGDGAPKDEKGKAKNPSIKYVCYVTNIKNKGGKDEGYSIELADLPYSVIKAVADYQENPDYAFDSFPMPYDLTVDFDPDAPSPMTMYKTIASPKREDVSEEIKQALKEKMDNVTPAKHVELKKDYQLRKHIDEGKVKGPDIAYPKASAESIPF